MEYKEDLLNILRFSSKLDLNDEEKLAFKHSIEKYDKKMEHILFNELNVHKIEFIFLKHLIELNCVYGIFDKRKIIEISERLAFLQIKYKEYMKEAIELSNVLTNENINFVWLKGASIIETLYKQTNVIYRNFGDFDILISCDDLNKANKIIENQGFVQGKVDNNKNIIKAERKEVLYWMLNSHQEMKFIKKSRFFNVSPRLLINLDVNTTIFEGGRKKEMISTKSLLNDTKRNESLNGYSLNSTFEFVQLCYHFYKDMQYESKHTNKQDLNLIKFCDIREYYHAFNEMIDIYSFVDFIVKCDIHMNVFDVLWMVADFYNDIKLKTFALTIGDSTGYDKKYDWDKLLLHYR